MARSAEAAGRAGEHQEVLRSAVRETDLGEAAARVAAVEASLRGAKRYDNLIPQAKHLEITTALRGS